MICGAFALAFASGPAFAQEAPSPQAAPMGAVANDQDTNTQVSQDEAEVEAVVVTGSRIARPNLVTTSPVTQVTGEDVDVEGVTRVEDLVNELPQAFAAQGSSISNGASGTATVNLRGLGASRTLVLIDGRRMPYGSPSSTAADLNLIPGQLIQRVEVLTGGASAVYGSDAVSGVVNFIMQKDFEGIQLDAQYSFFQHNNDYDGPGNLREVISRRAATNPAQFRLPEDDVSDGWGKEVTLIMGVSTPDGRGNVTAYAGYRNNDAVLQAGRDYSSCAIGSAGATEFTCGGSGTSFPGRFTDFGVNTGTTRPRFNFTLDPAGAGNTFRPFVNARDQYNFGPLNYYQRPDERYVLGAFGRYEVNERAEVFTQLMFMDYSTVAQIAPSGDFFSTNTINCDNPLISASQKAAIGCTTAAIAAGTRVPLYIGRRNVEGGGRQDDLRLQTYRGVIGVRGALAEGFDYDLAAQYARVQLSRAYRNEFLIDRLNRALDVVTGPGGQPTCRSVVDGTDAACVPYNVFSIGGVTPEALAYVQAPLLLNGATTQQVVTGAVTGDLGRFGVQSPLADRGVQVAVGAEYRRDFLTTTPDTNFETGNGAGQGGPTNGLTGETAVYELFGEIEVPLIQDRPFAQQVSVDAAYRFSDYETGVQSNTYKVGADYAPVEDLRFRASVSKAVRAPNVIDLFSSQGAGLFDMDEDPCGPARTATLAQCVATGVPSALYGSDALDSPAGQYQLLGGGNPNLRPEDADTYTFGFVVTPRFLPGFDLSVDYFNIEITELISSFGAQNSINACYQQNVAAACARIERAPNGSLFIGTGRVVDINTNIGGLSTNGIDINASYRFDLDRVGLGAFGGLNFNYVATLLQELVTDPGEGAGTPYDCASFYANECGTPNPEYRHRFRTTWQTPWNVDISSTWRRYGEVELFVRGGTVGDRVDAHLEAQDYFDLAALWQVRDNARLRVGVNNILDRDPPLSASVGAGFGNGNTFPQVYDALGRYVFVGLTADF